MFSSKQVVQYNLFGSNVLEGISSCKFAHFPEEVFEISSEENQVIDSLESKIENLQQENFDLKKNVELQKHYKKRVEEYYEEVSELTREMQTLEGKIKKLEVKLQKSTRSLTENDQDIEQLKQKVEILLLETQNKSDVIKKLNNQLKEAKNEIQLTDKINEELQQKLDLTEAELNRVRKESTVLINSIEDLKGNYENQILEKKKELNDIRDQLCIYLSEYKELFAEFSSLQKENESLKQKNFYISNEVSLADEINKENVRKEIARTQSIPEVETRCIKDNDDQEPTWLCREGENNQYDKTSEDKNLENIDFEIGVWNEADNESSDDQESTRLYEGLENNQDYRTSEDKDSEDTDYEIGVWNGTDSESDNISPCPDYDEGFGRRYSQLFYTDEITRKEKGKDTFLLMRQKDSFSLTKVKLNTREEEKYESIWQKINKIHDYLDILGYSGSEEDYEECEKELDKVISAALEQGIMFTFPYKSGMSLIDRIADTFQKLYLSADTTRIHEFLHKRKIFQVISEGASLNRSSDEEHEDFVNIICSDVDTLSKRSENLSKLKELAFESIMNKSEQIDEYDFELEIDNGYFCIDYPQNSIVEVARILNNQKAKDLNLNIGILQVGNSIIRVENIGGRRNYTEFSGDIIEMSFTTEVGEISIHLCPNEKDSNKIEVRLVDEVRFNKLENKSSLGQSCLLGGKSVLTAIENGYFERNSSAFKELGKTIRQSDCTMENPSSFLEGVNINCTRHNLICR
ncbi:coiled-coil domain-containing protein [Wolbachia endosymbiont (group B) of Villa cingulata]|uniref:coiled-coil domain-containing protein n=1 Tax=Wolbachia endosymbiont (group B) of Villa cingulata TaxID=3066157 RepID=UPI00333F93CC